MGVLVEGKVVGNKEGKRGGGEEKGEEEIEVKTKRDDNIRAASCYERHLLKSLQWMGMVSFQMSTPPRGRHQSSRHQIGWRISAAKMIPPLHHRYISNATFTVYYLRCPSVLQGQST